MGVTGVVQVGNGLRLPATDCLEALSAEPLTPIVEMFHIVFWEPTNLTAVATRPPNMFMWGVIAGVSAVVTLVIGELVFRKLDPRFAQEL